MEFAVIVSDSNLTLDSSTQEAFCFSPDILARANKMPMMTMSVASDGDIALVRM